MELRGVLLQLWTLSVLFLSSTQNESPPQNCSSNFTQLSKQLEKAVSCGSTLWSGWSSLETAQVLSSVSTLVHRLHSKQLEDCEGAQPHQCPPAEAPEHGGLLCVSVSNRRYCKPLCNHGYDFGYLRLSRVFDECSAQTGYKWNSQYVGGNRLAVCNEARLAVVGAKSANFPKEQSCLQSKANSSVQLALMEEFISEIQTAGHQGAPQASCLVCGLH